MAKWESGKTDASTRLSKELRGFYDDAGKEQITGLKALDEAYGAEIRILKQVKKDYFDKFGNFKDGAVNKIANLGGAGKQQVMDRLKKIVPDIEEQLNTLKAIEDIAYARERTVGTYARAVLGAGSVATGNVPGIIMAIVSTPDIAVPLLRRYGKSKLYSNTVIDNTIKNLQSGTPLKGKQLDLFNALMKESAEVINGHLKAIGSNVVVKEATKIDQKD